MIQIHSGETSQPSSLALSWPHWSSLQEIIRGRLVARLTFCKQVGRFGVGSRQVYTRWCAGPNLNRIAKKKKKKTQARKTCGLWVLSPFWVASKASRGRTREPMAKHLLPTAVRAWLIPTSLKRRACSHEADMKNGDLSVPWNPHEHAHHGFPCGPQRCT